MIFLFLAQNVELAKKFIVLRWQTLYNFHVGLSDILSMRNLRRRAKAGDDQHKLKECNKHELFSTEHS